MKLNISRQNFRPPIHRKNQSRGWRSPSLTHVYFRPLSSSELYMMEIDEQNEVWKETGEDMTYSHTKFILRKGDEYFYSRSSYRYRPLETVFPYDLEVYPIPAEDLWPAFPNNLTAAPDPLPAHCYVKRPSLIHHAEDHVFRPRDLLLEEAQIYEV